MSGRFRRLAGRVPSTDGRTSLSGRAGRPTPPLRRRRRRAGHRVKRSIRFGRPSSQSVGRPQPPPLLRLRCRPFPLGRSQRQNFRRSFRLRSGGHSFGLRRSLEDKILVRPRLRSPAFWLRARDKRFRLRLEARSFVLTSIWRPPFRSPSVSGPEYWSWYRPRSKVCSRSASLVLLILRLTPARLSFTVMPNSHRPPVKTRRSCLCRIGRCELSAFCVGVRPAVALRHPTHSDTDRTQNAPVRRSGRLSSHRHTRHDKTVLSVSCLAWRFELQTSNFPSATVLSCRESNSHHVSGVAVWQCFNSVLTTAATGDRPYTTPTSQSPSLPVSLQCSSCPRVLVVIADVSTKPNLRDPGRISVTEIGTESEPLRSRLMAHPIWRIRIWIRVGFSETASIQCANPNPDSRIQRVQF